MTTWPPLRRQMIVVPCQTAPTLWPFSWDMGTCGVGDWSERGVAPVIAGEGPTRNDVGWRPRGSRRAAPAERLGRRRSGKDPDEVPLRIYVRVNMSSKNKSGSCSHNRPARGMSKHRQQWGARIGAQLAAALVLAGTL